MIKKSRYEQIIILVGRDELAQMIGGEEGFEIETLEDKQSEIRFTLSRKTDFDEVISPPPKTNKEKRLFD